MVRYAVLKRGAAGQLRSPDGAPTATA